MTVIAVLSAKHSPGATTIAAVLAALGADDEPTLLLEADPAGGDLAVRAGLPIDPGLLTLAAAGRRGVSPPLLDAHTQRFANGAQVLLGPASAVHAHAALSALTGELAPILGDRPGLTVIDVGRWEPSSPSDELLRVADAAIVVFRPTIEGVEHLRSCLDALDEFTGVWPVAVGDRPYGPDEIRDVVGVDVTVVDRDPRAAIAINAGPGLDRWLRRSALVRSVSSLRQQLSGAACSPVEAS